MSRRVIAGLGSAAAFVGMVAAIPGNYSAPAAPVYVLTCQDPGRAWCGGDVYAVERFAPDGHYREDGSIPLAGQTAR